MGSNQDGIVSNFFGALQHDIRLKPRSIQRSMVVVLEHWPSWNSTMNMTLVTNIIRGLPCNVKCIAWEELEELGGSNGLRSLDNVFLLSPKLGALCKGKTKAMMFQGLFNLRAH
eukprot:10142420-Ditylum_brightwellii.AAC.1